MPPRGSKKSTGLKESIKVMQGNDKLGDSHIQAVSISNTQNTPHPEIPSCLVIPCDSATSTSHSAWKVQSIDDSNYHGEKPPLPPRGSKKSTGLKESIEVMQGNDKFGDSHIQAVSISNTQNTPHPEIPSCLVIPCDSATSTSHSASAANYSLRADSQQPSFKNSWEDQARPNHGDLGNSENSVQNSYSTHTTSHGVFVDHQQHLEGDGGGTLEAQNFAPRKPRDTERPYKQGFQIEQRQEYKCEEMLGKKISHSDPSERSQNSFHNPVTADTLPERPKYLAHGTNIPDYLVTENEKAGLEDKVKAVGGDSHAVAESSSEDSNGGQLHKDIDEEIHRFAEHVKEQVNSGLSRQVTRVRLPLDPNLVCPLCHKNFRIGQIQKFKKHVDNCW